MLNFAMLTGSGVSTAAGIPDFRSPGGMYDTLRPELLTATAAERRAMKRDPTVVVSWDLFKQNPIPYHEMRRPFILGVADNKWKMTISHYFTKLLHSHNILRHLFTQNIDGIDYQSGVPADKIVTVHGTIGRAACERCLREMDYSEFKQRVQEQIKDIYLEGNVNKEERGKKGKEKEKEKNTLNPTNLNSNEPVGPDKSTAILCPSCNKPAVKPTTVLYVNM